MLPDFVRFLEKEIENPGTRKQYSTAINQLFKSFLKQNYPDHLDEIEPQKKLISGLIKNDEKLIDTMNPLIKEKKRYYYKAGFKVLLDYLNKPYLSNKLRKVPKTSVKSKKKFVSFTTLRRFIEGCDGELRLIMMTQYDTACRSSDVLGLRYEDIEWEGERAAIHIIVKKTKEESTLYLSKTTTSMLKDYLNRLFKDVEEKDRMSKKIFTKRYIDYLKELKKLTKEKLGFEMTTHWLRSLRATHLAKKGRNIVDIQHQLTAKDMKTALRYIEAAGVDTKQIMEEEEPQW
jgi:integrase